MSMLLIINHFFELLYIGCLTNEGLKCRYQKWFDIYGFIRCK